MSTRTVSPATAPQPLHLAIGEQGILALVCLVAGAAPLAARWISADAAARVAYGLLIAALYLAATLLTSKVSSLRPYWELSLAFFTLAVVQVLNNFLPVYVATRILHAPPNAGDPLASTVSGTVVIQLLETFIAIIPVVLFARVSRRGLGSIYARPGKLGGWLVFAVVFFVACYVFMATLPSRPDSAAYRLLPSNGTLSPAHFVALTPALLVLALSNGFQEEFLFRGLFLRRYGAVLGVGAANVLQAVIFSIAHAGITYTPAALLFIVALIFPIGIFTGYLMRATNGVLAPGIFHAGFDLAIFLAFLSYAA